MEIQDNEYEDIEEIYRTVAMKHNALQPYEQTLAAEPMPSLGEKELAHLKLYCMLSVQLDSMQKNEDMMKIFEKLISQDKEKEKEKDEPNEKRKRDD